MCKMGLAALNSTAGGRKYEITSIKFLAQGLAHVMCLADKRHHPSQPRLDSVSLRKIILWSRKTRSQKQNLGPPLPSTGGIRAWTLLCVSSQHSPNTYCTQLHPRSQRGREPAAKEIWPLKVSQPSGKSASTQKNTLFK